MDLERRRRRVTRESLVALSLSTLAIALGRSCAADWSDITGGALRIWWLAFLARTLETHVGLLVLIVFALCLRDRLWKLAAACVPLLYVTLAADAAMLVRSPVSPPPGPTVKVFSVNLLMVNKKHDGIIGEIVAAKPDLLLIQELTEKWRNAIDPAVKSWLPHRTWVSRDDSFGIGIWSNRPFIGEPEQYVKISCGTPQIRAVVDLHGVPVALYNVHLLPPRTLDYTREHRAEMARFSKIFENEKLPVIMGGDFNFTEKTPQAATMARLGFIDAQDQGGTGRGATWPVIGVMRCFPGIRLDHVWLRGGLACAKLETGHGDGSDHRPISAEIVIESGVRSPESGAPAARPSATP